MLSYEQIADDIRTVLTAEIDPTKEVMRELDERYARAIGEVNERLRECGALLDNGLRTEAIHRCEAEPNLLNVVAIIDFPEFDVWADFAKQFGCPGPPRILTEIAEQLNDAYNEEASLGDLLRQHRLHALLRSPLPTRLSILRTLAHRDSGTPIWQDDIRAYEKVRHNQLRGEIEAAYAGDDLPALALLEQEVRARDWMQPPSNEIIDKATKSHTAVRVKVARRRLDQLVDELTGAHSGFDVARGRLLRSRWHAQAAIALDGEDDPLVELVAPALEWLAEQDRSEQEEADYASTLAAIDQALDDWVPRQDLERLYYKLQSFDREISPQLGSRLAERFEALDVNARRRSRLIALGSVALIILVGSVIAWGIYAHARAGVQAKYVASLSQLVASGSIAEAEAYASKLEQNAPEAYTSKEIQELVSQMHNIRAEEEGRQARLAQLLDSARESGATWEGYGPARGFLQDADEVVANELERAEAARVRREIEAIRRQLEKKYNDDFVADLASYASRCDAVDTTDLEALKRLMQEGELLMQRPRVADELIAQVKPLVLRLTAQRESELRSRDESQLLANIDRAVGDRRAFQAAMETYIEAMPLKPLSASLKQIIEKEPKIWDGIERWNAFLPIWEQRDYRSLPAAKAAELIAEAEAITTQHPGFPGVAGVRKLVDFLTPLTQRVDDEGRSKHLVLNERLTDNIPDLRMALALKNGQFLRYYFSPVKAPPKIGNDFSIYYYVDTGFEETRSTKIAPEWLRNDTIRIGNENEFDWTAPQTKFSRFALDRLAGFDQTKWESEFYELLKGLDADYAIKMAPQVRVQLLGLFLRVGCEGSGPMKEAYKSHLDLLDSTPLDEAPTWVDPEDASGKKTSTAATGLLNRLGFRTLENPISTAPSMTPRSVTGKVVELLNEKNKPKLAPRYAWVGWLRRDTLQKWTVVLRPDFDAENRELIVAYPGPNEQPQFTKVGTLVDDELDVRGVPSQALSIGRPVYIVAP